MKKIMIAFAAIATAFGLNAASVDWKVNDGAYNGKTIYVFNGTSSADLVALLATPNTDGAANFANYVATLSSGTDYWTGTGGKRATNSTFTDTAANSLAFIVFDSTIEGANTFYYTADQDTTSYLYSGANPSPGYLTVTSANFTSGTIATTGAVPEPTSALMLLLGMAGLALKRKVA